MLDLKTEEHLVYLQSFITEERLQKLECVLNERTRYVTIVLENIFDEHNANAVMRSCEGFGIQDVYVIKDNKSFKPAKKVLQGAHKWLTLHRFDKRDENNSLNCINDLKSKGYKIVVTSPHQNDSSPQDLEINQPLAIFFGQEHLGVSETVIQHADAFVKIPMHGFIESFNISVAAGIILHELTERIRQSNCQWQLSETEKDLLRFEWTKKCVKWSEKYFKAQKIAEEK